MDKEEIQHTQRAEWVKWEWGEEQGKNARDS